MSSKAFKITDHVYKVVANSNVYVLLSDPVTVIDCGDRRFHEHVREAISEIVPLSEVKRVLFTHFHYDHVGNCDLFSSAEFYVSKEEIEDFKRDPFGTVLRTQEAELFSKQRLLPVEDLKAEVLQTPGHTRGSLCYLWGGCIFTGDTKFHDTLYGRTDLPTSVPEELEDSKKKLKQYDDLILCPGHDYE